MSSDEHDYLSTYRFQKANEAHNLNSSSFSNNEMNTKRQPFEHSGSSYSRFVPASVQLKNQCLKSSYCFTENPSVQKFGLNSKEFKQIYRAQRDQISKTIQLDITYPLIDTSIQAYEVEDEFSNIYSINSNQFLLVSSLNSISDVQNPEEELNIAVERRETQHEQFAGSNSNNSMMNPEDEYDYATHNQL